MAGFVQIIEFQTSRPDEVEAMTEEYRKQRDAQGSGPMPVRAIGAVDRDHPGHYFSIVEFDSYDTAMENSQRPDTSDFAARMAELCDGPPTFHNLDVRQTM